VKIDLNAIDRRLFFVEETIVLATGETIYFVRPNPDAQGLVWTQKNKYFRSSVWDASGNLISAGFPKFEDLDVNNENFPPPKDLQGAKIYEKMDGALLIVSQLRKHTILRTRGVLDAESKSNGSELALFRKNILRRLIDYHFGNKTWGYSLLFEWLSPKHGLVVNYGEQPRFVLVGMINHSDYSLTNQPDLDQFATVIATERPMALGAADLTSLVQEVNGWTDRKGVVIYTNNGQTMHIIHSRWFVERNTKIEPDTMIF
jgi:hypothetical protein